MAAFSLHADKSHAESLLGGIDNLLNISGYQKEAITAIAVSAGPGSYTGLRIGLSTAKGLCYAWGVPLIGVSTLEALAAGVRRYHQNTLLCPMIDARRMEVYCLLTDGSAVLQEAHARVVDGTSFLEWLTVRPVVFFGDGAAKCRPVIAAHRHALFIDGIYPSAIEVGVAAYERLESGFFEDLASFEPLYLKPFLGGVDKK